MKLQKQVSRKTKRKSYVKWIIALPNDLIEGLNWKAGDDLKAERNSRKLILAQNKPNEKVVESRGKNEFSVFEKFAIVYGNLPLQERRLPVAVVDGQPISWGMAYKEMRQKTKLGKKIGKIITKLKIIQ